MDYSTWHFVGFHFSLAVYCMLHVPAFGKREQLVVSTYCYHFHLLSSVGCGLWHRRRNRRGQKFWNALCPPPSHLMPPSPPPKKKKKKKKTVDTKVCYAIVWWQLFSSMPSQSLSHCVLTALRWHLRVSVQLSPNTCMHRWVKEHYYPTGCATKQKISVFRRQNTHSMNIFRVRER